MIKKANLFIVGAAKCATTSLVYYLSQHKDIFFSKIKEPHYFCEDINRQHFRNNYKSYINRERKKYYKNGWAHILHISSEKEYNALYDLVSGETVIGEASTGYLFSTDAAINIKKYNSKAKIIIILRDPVDRAVSHYNMDIRDGRIFSKNMLKEMMKDYGKKKKGWGISNLYIELGMYSAQVMRYLEVFPRKQIKIINYNDLMVDANGVMNSICDFLEVERCDFLLEEKLNVASKPKNYFLFYIACKIKGVVPAFFKKNIKKHLTENGGVFLSSSGRSELYNIYREDINKLEEAVKINFNWCKENE